MPPTEAAPAAFIGHGNPMNALGHNRWTEAWRTFGATAPRPRAILVVSAHWFIGATAVTAMAAPPTIHDFYGFPEELFAVQYPAPGDPALAQEVVDAVAPTWVGLDRDSWGIDHGAWSVLVHLWPAADVPVLQLSIDSTAPVEHHVAIGAALEPLRRSGVMVVASGNVVHNLGLIDWSAPESGTDWAHRFDEAAREVMTTDPSSIASLATHADFRRSVPTPDHFLPLAHLAGLASASREPVRTLVDGYAYGSLSMTSYAIG